eukprot:359869-Chlamydomonas_euryale.AAC.7
MDGLVRFQPRQRTRLCPDLCKAEVQPPKTICRQVTQTPTRRHCQDLVHGYGQAVCSKAGSCTLLDACTAWCEQREQRHTCGMVTRQPRDRMQSASSRAGRVPAISLTAASALTLASCAALVLASWKGICACTHQVWVRIRRPSGALCRASGHSNLRSPSASCTKGSCGVQKMRCTCSMAANSVASGSAACPSRHAASHSPHILSFLACCASCKQLRQLPTARQHANTTEQKSEWERDVVIACCHASRSTACTWLPPAASGSPPGSHQGRPQGHPEEP